MLFPQKMRSFARQYSAELRQIDLDINRTFRNNLAYKKRYCQRYFVFLVFIPFFNYFLRFIFEMLFFSSPRQVQLYNILAAYSIYNTEIGYCQGMSTVTALLLMYLSDEEVGVYMWFNLLQLICFTYRHIFPIRKKTFWALSQLMSNSKYSLHGFFKRDFPKLIRYTDKHDMIIKTLLPKVHQKFVSIAVFLSFLLFQHFFLQIEICYQNERLKLLKIIYYSGSKTNIFWNLMLVSFQFGLMRLLPDRPSCCSSIL